LRNLPWHEDEISQAYDSRFKLLEAAREHYERSVKNLLESIRSELELRRSSMPLGEGLELDFGWVESGFARQALKCSLKEGDDASRLWVVTRMAAPWDGPAGRLQLGVAVDLDPKKTPRSVEDLRTRSRQEDWWNGISDGAAATRLEANWIHAIELDLTAPDLREVACRIIESLLTVAADLALEIHADYQFTERMLDVLERCGGDLRHTPVAPDWSWDYQRVGWWRMMHYVQIDHRDKPSFWVGFHVRDRCLMYGHRKFPDTDTTPERFAKAAGVIRGPEEYAGYPSGVLLEGDDLEHLSDEDLAKRIMALFSLFVETVNASGWSAPA
jgi:hypothetical protein